MGHKVPEVVRSDLHGWRQHHSKVPVRIATVSDLHTDFAENREAVVKLAVAIHEGRADVVVVAGDVSHKDQRIERALRAFGEVAPKVAYIPGNHDLWYDVPLAADRPELNTWHRYRRELKAICESADAHYLPSSPLVLGRTAIVGTCGWYDYSLMAPAFRAQVDDAALGPKDPGRSDVERRAVHRFSRRRRLLMPRPGRGAPNGTRAGGASRRARRR